MSAGGVVVAIVLGAGGGYVAAQLANAGNAAPTRLGIDEGEEPPPVPDHPLGKLTQRDGGYWKRQGVNPEKIKEGFVGRDGAKYDVYTDTKGNVWIKRKGEKDDTAIYAGELDDVLKNPDNQDDRARERNRGGGRRQKENDNE